MQVSERFVVELVVVDGDIVGCEVGRGFGESVELLGEVDTCRKREGERKRDVSLLSRKRDEGR